MHTFKHAKTYRTRRRTVPAGSKVFYGDILIDRHGGNHRLAAIGFVVSHKSALALISHEQPFVGKLIKRFVNRKAAYAVNGLQLTLAGQALAGQPQAVKYLLPDFPLKLLVYRNLFY
jgi:hypothetical protein